MTTTGPDLAAAQPSTVGTPIDTFAALHTAQPAGGWGAHLRLGRARAVAFRAELAGAGTPDFVGTRTLVSLPYPTRFGLWRAATSPAPFVTITNRMLVIRWTESDGRRRTLLFEPSDVERGVGTPFFAQLAAKTPQRLQKVMVVEHGSVLDHLAADGIDPADVDYLMFDHLHTQDVRRWLGTTAPQPDVSPDRPIDPLFPNAKLIVQRDELEAIAELHPLQKPWYQPETYRDLRPEGLLAIDGDVLLGPGVAVLATPGHVLGNQTLVLSTATGIWASSENAIATECLTPEHSTIPGVRRWASIWQQEVVLNANTIETAAQQYNSMVIEKTLVDHSVADGRFLQFFPSSELTKHWANPGTAPTFTHEKLEHGTLL
jgi:hypothetical protein